MKKNHFRLACILCLIMVAIGGCAGNSPFDEHQAAYQAYQEGDYELAAEKFEGLVAVAPKDPELWFRLGNAHARSSHPKEAITAYENALLRDPGMGKAWYNMGLVHLQAALKSFIDMENHVPSDDPIGRKGKKLQAEVFSLLEGQPAEDTKNED